MFPNRETDCGLRRTKRESAVRKSCRISPVRSASGKSKVAESGNIVPGVFTPVLAKHSKSFSLIGCIAVGVDRMQRNFEPMRKQEELTCRSLKRALPR